jgi:hypothetical protein
MPPSSIVNVKNKYFQERFRAFMKKEFAEENYLFVFDKANAEVLYKRYIQVGVPLEVNISDALRKPLVALAAAKKWSAMSAPMQKARAEITNVVDQGPLARFAATEEGKLAGFMEATGVDGSKADTMLGLLQVFKKPRTPQDKLAAHTAMQKLTSLAKLNPALRALGLELPVRAPAKKGDPAKALKLMGVPPKLVPTMTKLIAAYAAAPDDTAKKKVLEQMNKIAKDVVKADLIIASLKSSGLY